MAADFSGEASAEGGSQATHSRTRNRIAEEPNQWGKDVIRISAHFAIYISSIHHKSRCHLAVGRCTYCPSNQVRYVCMDLWLKNFWHIQICVKNIGAGVSSGVLHTMLQDSKQSIWYF